MMARRYLNVMLVPDDQSSVKSYRVSRAWIPAAFGAGAFVLCLAVGFLVAGVQNVQMRSELHRTRLENGELRAHVESLGGRLDRLTHLVHDSEKMERQARLLAGLDPIDEQTRQMGVGGPLERSPGPGSDVDPELGATMNGQSRRLDALARQVSFQKESYTETLDRLETQKDRLDHLPTIPPLRVPYMRTSGFGPRIDPFTGEDSFHYGFDLRAPLGSPVCATGMGKVSYVARRGDFGLTVMISHGKGLVTQYSHLKSTTVKKGQEVTRGQLIGTLGSSGRSTGPHVHYEVLLNGVPQNPRKYILTSEAILD